VSRLKQHTISFRHALDGVIYTFRTQPNFQVHTFFAILAAAAGFIFRISSAEWAVIVFIIGLVLVAEMINTSIEAVVDLHTEKFHELARVSKDVSAGMVLVTATMAVITGILIFLPHLLTLFR
jgi:diacylglycerol kinase